MPTESIHPAHHTFTLKILVSMCLGALVGLLFQWVPMSDAVHQFFITDIFKLGGDIFIRLIKMLVVPIVFVSLVCGSSSLGDLRQFGRIGVKTFILYLFTTAVAVAIALCVAQWFSVGKGVELTQIQNMARPVNLSWRDIVLSIFPTNPIAALAQGNMLQIIFFSLLLGIAISTTREKGALLADLFNRANAVLMRLITMIMQTAPYGVFFLLAALFARVGFSLIYQLLGYFLIVLLVLAIQFVVVYGSMLRLIGRLNPILFVKKMRDAILFAFSVSSSNASIPIVLKTVEERLGVSNAIASFIIPLGSTINMDGTAIMQGVATVFIANVYHVSLGLTGYLTVIVMATLASIGAAGVPSVGLITLAMVLQQVGLPVQGIALIIGVDRLLDMARTSVNIAGDAMIACLVAKSESALDQTTYMRPYEAE